MEDHTSSFVVQVVFSLLCWAAASHPCCSLFTALMYGLSNVDGFTAEFSPRQSNPSSTVPSALRWMGEVCLSEDCSNYINTLLNIPNRSDPHSESGNTTAAFVLTKSGSLLVKSGFHFCVCETLAVRQEDCKHNASCNQNPSC